MACAGVLIGDMEQNVWHENLLVNTLRQDGFLIQSIERATSDTRPMSPRDSRRDSNRKT